MSAPVIRDGDEGRHSPPNVGLLTINHLTRLLTREYLT